MKIKAIFEGTLIGIISAILSYSALVSPATIAAIAIRRKMPGAWFSGMIVWYATFLVVGVSVAIAAVAFWTVYKRAAGQFDDREG